MEGELTETHRANRRRWWKPAKKVVGFTLITLLFLTVALFSFRHILSSPGVIGLVYEWGLPPFSGQFNEKIGWDFSAWKPFPDLGSAGSPTVGLYFDLAVNGLYSLGLDGAFVSKFLCILLMTVAGLSAYFLARKFKLGLPGSLIAGLIYMLSPFVFERFVVGHLVILLDYAILPLVLGLFIGSLEKPVGFRYFVAAGLLFTLGLSHLTTVFIAGAAMLLYCVVHGVAERQWKQFLLSLRNVAFLFVVPLLIHSFWIVPLLLQVLGGQFGASVGDPVGNLPARMLIAENPYMAIEYSGRLMGYAAAWFFDVGNPHQLWQIASWVLPSLALSSLLLAPRRRLAAFSALIAVTGILLTSAQTGPLGSAYYWVFERLPFLAIFRDPSYWIQLTIIGYGLLVGSLVGIAVDFLGKASIDIAIIRKERRFSLARWLMAVIPVCAVVFFAIPFQSGNFGTLMQTGTFYNQDHEDVWRFVRDNPEDFRPLEAQGPYPNYYQDTRWGYDMMAVYAGKPGLYYGRVYDPQVIRFMYKTMYDNKTRELGKLLGLLNVKYLIYDEKKFPGVTAVNSFSQSFPEEIFTNERLLTTLDDQRDIVPYKRFGDIAIYENLDFLPHLFATSGAALYAGNLDGMLNIASFEDETLSRTGLVFVDQLEPRQLEQVLALAGTRLVIQDGHVLDLVIAAAEDKQDFSLFAYGAASSARKGWAPLWEMWYDWRYQANTGRALYTFVASTIDVPYSVARGGEYYLFLKPYFGLKRSPLTVTSDANPLGEITTGTPADLGFQWRQLGPFTLAAGSHSFRIDSGESENALGGMILIPGEAVAKAEQKIASFTTGTDATVVSKFNVPGTAQRMWERSAAQLQTAAGREPNPRYPSEDQYEMKVADDALAITLPLHRKGGDDEAFYFTIDTSADPISLEQTPYLGLNYKVQDPNLQTAIIRLMLDTDGDGKSDVLFRSHDDGEMGRAMFRNPGAKEFRPLEFNALAGARLQYPDKKTFRVVGIEIDFRKIHEADLSGPLAGDYSFYLKELYFTGAPLFLAEQVGWASEKTTISTAYPSRVPIHQQVSVPTSGRYNVSIRAASESAESGITVNIGGTRLSTTLRPAGAGSLWHDLGQANLQAGTYDATVTPDGTDNISLDMIVLATQTTARVEGQPTVLRQQKISHSKYTVSMQTEQPFFLFFSELYNQDWKLTLSDGTAFRPLPGYSFGNLFYVDRTGDLDMTLEFTRQKEYSFFLLMSFAGLGLSIAALVAATVFRAARRGKPPIRFLHRA